MSGEILNGRLATGIGMGKHFTRLDWARDAFHSLVGIDPFPGTVNVVIDDPDSAQSWQRIKREPGLHIENPGDGPHHCDAKCFPVLLSGDSIPEVKGAIVFPLVDDYPPMQVEVIAEIGVRDAYGIEDGEPITLTLTNAAGD